MLARYLITAATAFLLGFGIAVYWQSTLRELDTAKRDAGDAKATVQAHEKNVRLGSTINSIEATSMKEIHNATNEADRIRHDLTAGAIRLQLNATCPELPAVATGARLPNGSGARFATAPRQHRETQSLAHLRRVAEPDYLALRQGIQRCHSKVTALQAILKEERDVGNSK
ncbi:MAG: lysis system i-spanin subunit Rz [Alphaproteobacteria bacterium]|nr:lysis system i-spanin subunit Rz [Alphaproteobacteria bacterium]